MSNYVLQYVIEVMLAHLCINRVGYFFFFKQKTAYEMRISDWSSDVCSSDLIEPRQPAHQKSGSSGSFRVAAPQSAAQAVCAMGLANNATSGLMSAVSASSCHSGSISVTYAISNEACSRQATSVNNSIQYSSG